MAERGVAEAQFKLGVSFAHGRLATPDYAQAEHWYLLAAAQDHALAQFNLGMMHANGQGMPRDSVKSLGWIQKAAELGDAGAQYRLGLSHQRAIRDGRPENISQSRLAAYKWLRLAADQSYQGAESACELVNLGMSRADVLEGRRLVADFLEQIQQRKRPA
jgi:TPR repeat protein